MRIPTPIQALSAAAALALLAGCSSGSAIAPSSITPQGHGTVSQRMSHAFVAPGRAGQLAFSIARNYSHGLQHDSTATAPCTYLSLNLTGDVVVYNNNLTQAGDFASSSYGWGAYATGSRVFLGTNNGTGNIDTFHPCTNTPMGASLTGLNAGGNPYSIAGFKNSIGHPQGYATDWPNDQIAYWATGSGTATAKVDPNIALPYFLDVDGQGRLYVVGYNSNFSGENKTITSCTTLEFIAGGFPGGVQVNVNNNVYVNDQFGTIHEYGCAGTSCTTGPTFTYNNGSNPLDYTAIVINKNRTKIVGANIYLCSDGCSFGVAGDAQAQSLPLSSATLGASTPGIDNNEPLGVALWKADAP
jgi:hypothetical protein